MRKFMEFYSKNSLLQAQGCIIFFMAIVLYTLLFANFAAAADFEKSYNKNTQTILIKDKEENNAATVKLLTPVNNIVWGTGEQKIAEIEIDSENAYENVLSNIMFYDYYNRISKSGTYKLKYLSYENVERDIIERDCHPIGNDGASECELINKGKEIIKQRKWNELNSKDVPKGKITIGIYYSDVQPEKRIEWIPKFFGMDFLEWADFIAAIKYEWFNNTAIADTTYPINSSGRQAGQTFRVGSIGTNSNFTVSGVSLYIGRTANADLTNISIYTLNTTGVPNQSISSNTTFNATFEVSLSAGWVNISLPSFKLVKNTNYAIVIDRTSFNPSEIIWSTSSTSTYLGGNTQYRLSGTWYNVSYADCLFELWGYFNPDNLDISLIAPVNKSILPKIETNFSAYLNILDDSLTNLTLYIDNFQVRNISLSGNNLNQGINYNIENLSYGNHNWSLYVCGNFNHCKQSETLIFNAGYVGINEVFYNLSTFETSPENYIINITYDSVSYSGISAYIVYNGTPYISSASVYGDYIVYTNLLTVPGVTSNTNMSFYWAFYLTNSTKTYNFNSSSYSQYVSKIGSGIFVSGAGCSAGLSPAFFFDFNDEENFTKLTASSVYYNIKYGFINNSGYTLSNNLSSIQNLTICINNSFSYFNLGYGEIQYNIDSYSHRRYYLFENTRIVNQTIYTSLYSLDSDKTTAFQVSAKSTSLIPYSNHYIVLLRWYPNLNEYRVVEISKTDESGESVFKAKIEDVDYRLGIYQSDGTLIKLLNPIRLICKTTPCTYSIYISSLEEYTSFFNVQTNLSYDPALKKFNFIWNDPSQLTQTMNLTVWKLEGNNYRNVCSSSGTGFIGYISCDVSSQSGILKAIVTRIASPPVVISQLIKEIRVGITSISEGGILTLFFTLILAVFMTFVGIFSPIASIILLLVSLIPAVVLGGMNITIFLSVAALGGIVWHFVKNTTG